MTDDALRRMSNLAELVGGLDLCDCEHCRSVLGPAAYLVELLAFLDREDGADDASEAPLDVLLRRRPDLAHLRLSCENTTTVLPYVDLVNEVLESFLVAGEPSADAAHDVEDFTTEELLASPRHVAEAAYARLAETRFPITLPFDRPLELVRAYLRKLGIERTDLLAEFDPAFSGRLAAERLGVTMREHDILTVELESPDAEFTLAELYGLDDHAAVGVARHLAERGGVAALLAATQLDYSELLDVLRTRTVNPGQADLSRMDDAGVSLDELRALRNGETPAGVPEKLEAAVPPLSMEEARERAGRALRSLVIVDEDGHCELAQMRLQTLDRTPADDASLHRLHRLVRLARRLGWSFATLDTALVAVRLGAQDEAHAIRRLSQLRILLDATGLDVADLASLWAPIDTHGPDSLYARLFLRSVVGHDDHFALRSDGRLAGEAEAVDLHSKLSVLAAAFRARVSDLVAIMDHGRLADGEEDDGPQLTLDTISVLHRHVILARALRLAVSELLALADLGDLDPFADPAATLSFRDLVATVEASGFTVGQLAYLLRHAGEPARALGPSDAVLEELERSLREGLAVVREERNAALEEALGRDTAVAALASSLDLEEPLIRALTVDDHGLHVIGDPSERAITAFLVPGSPPVRGTYERLHKVALLIRTFTLSLEELRLILEHPGLFADLDLNSLPLDESDPPVPLKAWKRLAELHAVRGQLDDSAPSAVVEILRHEPGAWTDTLVARTRWPVAVLAEALRTAAPSSLEGERLGGLSRVLRLAGLSHRIGVGADELQHWASSFPADHVAAVRETLKARYRPDAWLAVERSVHDPLRERQRDALVAYVLTMRQIRDSGVETPDQLFEFFLMDVGMSSCMATSRVKQAISSVQLFVQRCLLNLERHVAPDEIDRQRWEWRRQYRLWEANRKVFLYPENWLEPEVRDDRTPFFRELEADLREGDITEDAVASAVRNYMRKLEEVAHLRVCGTFLQTEDAEPHHKVLHVFARTRTGPAYRYFYRRLLDDTEWTPWEQVPVDIDPPGNGDDSDVGGTHLLPVVVRGQLHLLWPVFTVESDAPTNFTATAEEIDAQPPARYLRVQLAWSTYRDGAWSPKQRSEAGVLTRRGTTGRAAPATPLGTALLRGSKILVGISDDSSFSVQVLEDDLSDWLARWGLSKALLLNPFRRIRVLGRFRFSSVGDQPFTEVSAANHGCRTDRPGLAPSRAGVAAFNALPQHAYFAPGPLALKIVNPRAGLPDAPSTDEDAPVEQLLLSGSVPAWRILAPHNLFPIPLSVPLFYDDGERTYFIGVEEQVERVVESLEGIVAPGVLARLTDTPAEGSVWERTGRHPWAGVQRTLTQLGSQDDTDIGSSLDPGVVMRTERSIEARFESFSHLHVREFRRALERQGVAGLFDPRTQALGNTYLDESAPWRRFDGPRARGPAALPDRGGLHALVVDGTNVFHYIWAGIAVREATVSDAATGPASLTQGTAPGRFEAVIQETSGVRHYRYDGARWQAGAVIAPAPAGPSCVAAADRGGTRGLHALVVEGDELVHYWNSGPGWNRLATVTDEVAAGAAIAATSRLEALVPKRLRGDAPPYRLVHYMYDTRTGEWAAVGIVTDVAAGSPGLTQGRLRYGREANLEAVVIEGAPEADGSIRHRQLVHYTKDGSDPDSQWKRGLLVSPQADGPGTIAHTEAGVFEVLVAEGEQLAHYRKDTRRAGLFADRFSPTELVRDPYPREDVDFEPGGAYAVYNWELFFHIPFLVARRLRQNQRFAEAQKWLRFIFDPTTDSPEATTHRFWKFLPLRDTTGGHISRALADLGAGDGGRSRTALLEQLKALHEHPFQPYRIARLRLTAFKTAVVMEMVDTLLSWADQLFRRDTIESINEATQLYVLAADLLGPRPQQMPASTEPSAKTFAELRGSLDEFVNRMEREENRFPLVGDVDAGDGTDPAGGLLGAFTTLHYCIPQNDRLLERWDQVADRLFKVRHCMNIEGVVRQLPLFEPPVDPALLVQAAAAGVSLQSALADVHTPTPRHRFLYLLQKAQAFCDDVRSLGAALLAALEKRDGEALARLRAGQELKALDDARVTRVRQLEEAEATVATLDASRRLAETRLGHYRRLLGETADLSASEATPPRLDYPASSTISSSAGARLLAQEQEDLDETSTAAALQLMSSFLDVQASYLHALPNTSYALKPYGVGTEVTWGSTQLANIPGAFSAAMRGLAGVHAARGTRAAKMAGHLRRDLDAILQHNLAALDIAQIDKQLAAARIRVAIAQQDLANHDRQVVRAREIADFLRDKLTGEELYAWMRGQRASAHLQMFQLAYELAKKAERAYQVEHGLSASGSNFIRYGTWDGLHHGLLAGERLGVQLRQLERAHLDHDDRELEITKHVSLRLIDPMALIRLKATGECILNCPEALFDADYPGHFLRRVRRVALTIPAVTGPYTSINCTLTLVRHETRISPDVASDGSDYAMGENDLRFAVGFGGTEAIVTSHGRADGGQFTPAATDERLAPFERTGVVSRWRIELPPDTNAFDLDTINDVVLTIDYTAKDGGEHLRSAARAALGLTQRPPHPGTEGAVTAPGQAAQLFSLRHQFASAWAAFVRNGDEQGSLPVELRHEHFPYRHRGHAIDITEVLVFLAVRPSGRAVALQPVTDDALRLTDPALDDADGRPSPEDDIPHRTFTTDGHLSVLPGQAGHITFEAAPNDLAGEQLDDLWLLVRYRPR